MQEFYLSICTLCLSNQKHICCVNRNVDDAAKTNSQSKVNEIWFVDVLPTSGLDSRWGQWAPLHPSGGERSAQRPRPREAPQSAVSSGSTTRPKPRVTFTFWAQLDLWLLLRRKRARRMQGSLFFVCVLGVWAVMVVSPLDCSPEILFWFNDMYLCFLRVASFFKCQHFPPIRIHFVEFVTHSVWIFIFGFIPFD